MAASKRAGSLRPFFSFYGGKWRAATHYPLPTYHHIIEPFAGSAGYSVRYHAHQVTLVERDPLIASTWRYLLHASSTDILSLPDIQNGQLVDDLPVCQEARTLIGWWLNAGCAQPGKRPSAWMRASVDRGGEGYTTGGGKFFWGQRVRERLARQLEGIRHWTLIEGDFTTAPHVEATWFIDPPYQSAGKHYRYGSKQINYDSLADWCRTRLGQVIVCENTRANWLPFRAWRNIKASEARYGGKVSHEAIWVQG